MLTHQTDSAFTQHRINLLRHGDIQSTQEDAAPNLERFTREVRPPHSRGLYVSVVDNLTSSHKGVLQFASRIHSESFHLRYEHYRNQEFMAPDGQHCKHRSPRDRARPGTQEDVLCRYAINDNL